MRHLIILLLSISISNLIFGQDKSNTIGKVTISSPNAAALGKYGDIPVGYHTGIPNISIPIYTIKSGNLQLPIGLSYHAGGLKVQEQASWVGAGWSLNAGGVITRTVIGAPDDRGLGYGGAYTTKGHFSDYGYNSYLFGAGPATCSGNLGCPSGLSYPPQDSYLQSGIFDGEPDLYFFNFNGYSGKFYFNDDRTPVLVPQQDLQITPIYPGNDWRGITGFIVTTPDGTKYFFGKNQEADGNIDATEITYNVTTQSVYTGQGATSGWYLNKIASFDDKFIINLYYENENYSYYTLSMFPVPSVRNPNWYGYNLEYDLDKNLINGVRLRKIKFTSGEVNFVAGDLRLDMGLGLGLYNGTGVGYGGIDEPAQTNTTLGARSLGAISISTDNFCKKYSFNYGYFYDNSPLTGSLFTGAFSNLGIQSDKYRLRLDSLQESSCDNSLLVPPYVFSYESGTVPRKLSFGIDHWGFNNGVNTNSGLIPTYTVTDNGNVSTVSGANRESAWPEMKSGSLKEILYPTGGRTTFEFEPNTVYQSVYSFNSQTRANASVLYDGNPNNSVTLTTTSASNTYKLVLSSTTIGVGGNLHIVDASGNIVNNYSITTGTSTTYYINLLPSSTYTLNLYGSKTTNNWGGCTATLYEQVPVITLSNTIVGGLRIKSITNNDGITNLNSVKTFNYNFNKADVNGQSSAVLYSRPVYVQAIRNDAYGIVNGNSCNPSGCLTCFGSSASYYQSPSSIRPMASTQGSHIGYGEVYVSEASNGYSVYKYYGNNGSMSHPWDSPITDVCTRKLNTFCDPNIPNSPSAPLPFDPMRGELAYEAHYNQAGNILKSSNYYPDYQFDSLITPGIITKFFVTGYQLSGTSTGSPAIGYDAAATMSISTNLTPVGLSSFTEYFLQSAKKVRDSVETVTYDPVNNVSLKEISTVYYGSKYHNEVTKKLTYASNKDVLSTNYKYAFDFRISNYSTADQLNNYYVAINTAQTSLANALNSITLSWSDPYYYWQRLSAYTNFRYQRAVARQNYINYRRQNFTDPNNSYGTAHASAKQSANNDLKPILQLQDDYNNAIIEGTNYRNSNLLHANFTKYDFSTNSPNLVYPQATQNINLLAPSSTMQNAAVNTNSLTKDSRYTDETNVQFKNGNVVQVTDKAGVVTSYLWGYNEQYPVAKIIGKKYSDIISSNLVDLSVINNSTLTDVQMRAELFKLLQMTGCFVSTYTYKPLVGISSETDTNGRTSYYEYDALGRLKLIRDKDNNIIKSFDYSYQQNP